MTTRDLGTLRKAVDDIDAVILSAIGERARLAGEIADAKAAGETPVRDPAREAALLAHRAEIGERLGLDPQFVRRIFRELMSDSVHRQGAALQAAGEAHRPLVVAYQGTEGAYGHLAACRAFAPEPRPVTLKAYPTFRAMLEAVQRGDADRGVLPIENSTTGSVVEAYDLLTALNLAVAGEQYLEVRHCLVGVADIALADIRAVHSHPQALSQCSEFLARLAGATPQEAANTAIAAERVKALGDPAQVAIASEDAAAHFGLLVLRREIANQAANYTRFVLVAAAPVPCDPRLAAKVSILFGTRHEHGALARCLNVVAEEGLNLTKLESRPRPGMPWEYVFHADFEGHLDSPRVQAALARLAQHTMQLKVLGGYPAAPVPGRA
jgi:chorismate mutase/prephenate dehydratase